MQELYEVLGLYLTADDNVKAYVTQLLKCSLPLDEDSDRPADKVQEILSRPGFHLMSELNNQ